MKFGAILTALFLLFSAASLALPDMSDAARLGGGKSFGSKPFMRTPAQPPAAQRPAATAPRANTAQQKPGMFGGMGGIFGGLLAGTLLGSLLSGNGFAGGGGFMDIILLGILAFITYKLFMRFRNRQAPQSAPSGAGMFGGQSSANGMAGPIERSDVASGWESLKGARGNAASYSTPQNSDLPANFNVDEFLRGAKMSYNRLQKSWDNRDLADIARFATPAIMEELEKQNRADPKPGNTEIMLVNAQLVGFERDGADERAEVYFDVLMRENPAQATPNQAREIWHFVRHGANGEWKLDGIQQVE